MTPEKWNERYPRFKLGEIYSPEGLEHLERDNYRNHIINFEFMDLVNAFAWHIDSPVIINKAPHFRRGVRLPEESFEVNKITKKSPWAFSYHAAGLAVDISTKQFSPEDLFSLAMNFEHNGKMFRGFGVYSTWLHLDMRPWQGVGFAKWEG